MQPELFIKWPVSKYWSCKEYTAFINKKIRHIARLSLRLSNINNNTYPVYYKRILNHKLLAEKQLAQANDYKYILIMQWTYNNNYKKGEIGKSANYIDFK